MKIPIACMLTATEAPDRVEEWRTFLHSSVLGIEHEPGGTVARLRLELTDEVLLAAADLSRRERACCAFFRFRLRLDLDLEPDALWFEVEVPPDAAPVLDGLVGLAPRPTPAAPS